MHRHDIGAGWRLLVEDDQSRIAAPNHAEFIWKADLAELARAVSSTLHAPSSPVFLAERSLMLVYTHTWLIVDGPFFTLPIPPDVARQLCRVLTDLTANPTTSGASHV